MSTSINMLGGGGGGGGGSSIMLTFSISDEPGDGQIVMIPIIAGLIITIPSGMTNSKGKCVTVPTADADFDVQKNGVSAGTISFALGVSTATFVAASDIVLEGDSSDYLKIICPTPQDSTLANVGLSIMGTKS